MSRIHRAGVLSEFTKERAPMTSERTPQDVLRELRAAVEKFEGWSVPNLALNDLVRRREVLALINKAIAEAPDTLSEKPGLDVERLRLRAALTDAYATLDAACQWAAGETGGVKTIVDADRHVAGYDRLLDGTVRAGRALGILSDLRLGSTDSEGR